MGGANATDRPARLFTAAVLRKRRVLVQGSELYVHRADCEPLPAAVPSIYSLLPDVASSKKIRSIFFACAGKAAMQRQLTDRAWQIGGSDMKAMSRINCECCMCGANLVLFFARTQCTSIDPELQDFASPGSLGKEAASSDHTTFNWIACLRGTNIPIDSYLLHALLNNSPYSCFCPFQS